MAAWTKKSGTIPDLVTAILVYNSDDSEPNLILDATTKTVSGDAGILERPIGNEPTYPACTSGEWGFAEGGNNIYTPEITFFEPRWLEFVDGTQGSNPTITIDGSASAATTVMLLLNSVDTISEEDSSVLWSNDSAGGMAIGIEDITGGYFTVRQDSSPQIVESTKAWDADTPPYCIAAHMRRHATESDNELFYSTKTAGSMASVSSRVGNTSNGSTKELFKWGARPSSYEMSVELYMMIIADEAELSTAQMNTIIADPLGTLVDTGAAASTSDVNFTASNRGIMRGVGRGVG